MIELILIGILFGVPISLVCVMHILKYLDKKQRKEAVKAEVACIMEYKCRSCQRSEDQLRKELAEKEAALAAREEKLSRNSRARIERQLLHEFSASDLHVFLPDIYPCKDPRLWPDELKDRLLRTTRDNISIKNIHNVYAITIGSDGAEYFTSLKGCSCPDYQMRLAKRAKMTEEIKPCKHMLYLYLHLGHAAYTGADVRRYTKQYQEATDAASLKKYKT